jgi:hypothetical protein
VPAGDVCVLPDDTAADVAVPGRPLTVMTSGGRLPAVTVTAFGPAIRPSVQFPTAVGDPDDVCDGALAIVGEVASGSPAVPTVMSASEATDAGGGGAVLSPHANAVRSAAAIGREFFAVIRR